MRLGLPSYNHRTQAPLEIHQESGTSFLTGRAKQQKCRSFARFGPHTKPYLFTTAQQAKAGRVLAVWALNT